LRNPSGLHARPAALFVQTAGRFQSEIRVRNLTTGLPAVNGKSILNVVTIGALQGNQIAIHAEGADAQAALAALKALVEDGFGE
jgi:phosphotransferase system HPr (HPr) family protein